MLGSRSAAANSLGVQTAGYYGKDGRVLKTEAGVDTYATGIAFNVT